MRSRLRARYSQVNACWPGSPGGHQEIVRRWRGDGEEIVLCDPQLLWSEHGGDLLAVELAAAVSVHLVPERGHLARGHTHPRHGLRELLSRDHATTVRVPLAKRPEDSLPGVVNLPRANLVSKLANHGERRVEKSAPGPSAFASRFRGRRWLGRDALLRNRRTSRPHRQRWKLSQAEAHTATGMLVRAVGSRRKYNLHLWAHLSSILCPTIGRRADHVPSHHMLLE